MSARPLLTVSQVAAHLGTLLRDDETLADLTVRGELSNWRVYSSGHCYFTLKDAGGELRAVMFRGAAARLRFEPADGVAVRATGRVELYEKRGEVQLYVEAMEHDGAGTLWEAYERLKRRLEAEGLFDPRRKRDWPLLPRRVAVITSPTGAAVADMLRILRNRWPGVKILLVPSLVQGPEAPASLVRALGLANRVEDVDVILFGRGGGSLEDLWSFNEEVVARAVAASRAPVISCVGHETDFTISDFAADVRAATPSHAAQLAVPDVAEMVRALAGLDARLYRLLAGQLAAARARFAAVAGRRVLSRPEEVFERRAQALDDFGQRLERAVNRRVERAGTRFAGLAQTLRALDPSAVLARGYAIVTRAKDQKVVQSAADLPAGEPGEARLAHGTLAIVSAGEAT